MFGFYFYMLNVVKFFVLLFVYVFLMDNLVMNVEYDNIGIYCEESMVCYMEYFVEEVKLFGLFGE